MFDTRSIYFLIAWEIGEGRGRRGGGGGAPLLPFCWHLLDSSFSLLYLMNRATDGMRLEEIGIFSFSGSMESDMQAQRRKKAPGRTDSCTASKKMGSRERDRGGVCSLTGSSCSAPRGPFVGPVVWSSRLVQSLGPVASDETGEG